VRSAEAIDERESGPLVARIRIAPYSSPPAHCHFYKLGSPNGGPKSGSSVAHGRR
jgi:hypothetical protein